MGDAGRPLPRDRRPYACYSPVSTCAIARCRTGHPAQVTCIRSRRSYLARTRSKGEIALHKGCMYAPDGANPADSPAPRARSGISSLVFEGTSHNSTQTFDETDRARCKRNVLDKPQDPAVRQPPRRLSQNPTALGVSGFPPTGWRFLPVPGLRRAAGAGSLRQHARYAGTEPERPQPPWPPNPERHAASQREAHVNHRGRRAQGHRGRDSGEPQTTLDSAKSGCFGTLPLTAPLVRVGGASVQRTGRPERVTQATQGAPESRGAILPRVHATDR
jgi:hypothetical protein